MKLGNVLRGIPLSTNQPSHKNSILKVNLRTKFILGFVAIILVLSSLNILTYYQFSSSMKKLDEMIQVSLVASNITASSKDVREKLREYLIYQRIDDQESIIEAISLLEASTASLTSLVVDSDGKDALSSVVALSENFKLKAMDTIQLADLGNLTEATAKNEQVVRAYNFLYTGTNDFISTELKFQQEMKAELNENAIQNKYVMVISIVIVIAISMFGAILFSNRIARNISSLAQQASSIAEGNLGMPALQINSHDDMEVLANAFNKMSNNLCDSVYQISVDSSDVAETAENLKANVELSAVALEQIAILLQSFSQGAYEQVEQTKKTADTVQKLLVEGKQNLQFASNVLDASVDAKQASISGNEKMIMLQKQTDIIKVKIVNTQSATERLQHKTDAIENIVATITKVSTQSNILAFNAGIEAARAGEHGRGFREVAKEMKRLAEESKKAALEITGYLHEIQEESADVAKSMLIGVREIHEGAQLVDDARRAFGDIAQKTSIVESQNRVVSEGIGNMIEGFKSVESMSRYIEEIALNSSNGSQEAAAAVEEQTARLEEVTGSAYILNNMADSLRKLISQYNTKPINK